MRAAAEEARLLFNSVGLLALMLAVLAAMTVLRQRGRRSALVRRAVQPRAAQPQKNGLKPPTVI
jgi:hypothetical protein